MTGLCVIALAGAGCATQPALPRPAENTNWRALAARERLLRTLESSAVMEYTAPGRHFKVRERVTLRRPASLRVEALSPLGVALVVAADASEIAVFDPAHDTITRGAATAETLGRVARIPLAPERAVRLLLALPPDPAMTIAPITADQSGASISFTEADGTLDQMTFVAGDLALMRATSAAGTLVYEVRYSDYHDLGAIQLPLAIDASFPDTATTVELRYANPIIDGTVPDAAFVLTPGPRTREVRLGANHATPRTTG